MTTAKPWARRWQRFSAASVRGFHNYANWLVGISWQRFVLLSVLLMVLSALLQNIPPFSWSVTRMVSPPGEDGLPTEPPAPPAVPGPARKPSVHIDAPRPGGQVEIVIDEQGVRITPRGKAAPPAAPAASVPAPASGPPAELGAGAATAVGAGAAASATAEAAAASAAAADSSTPSVLIRLPPGSSEAVKAAVEEARQSITEAVQEARQEADSARRDAAQTVRDAEQALRQSRHQQRVEEHISLGEFLPSQAMLWIVASLIIKITYKRQIQAEAQAAQAVETAGAESLKRQVVEARMAAMQAQVEPHFLFNTLASIDHLIETDPRRASQMQKNLIALLRASMPTMREASDGGVRELGRELAVIRPYLEILKVRMEERLTTRIDVPEGLLSAEFPSMMMQSLVENAIKHGLEPKPEGGELSIKAEIVHGKLTLTVADTGLGFGRAATAGTGVGLANIRDRLALLYGGKATLSVNENQPSGTRVTIAVPYTACSDTGATP